MILLTFVVSYLIFFNYRRRLVNRVLQVLGADHMLLVLARHPVPSQVPFPPLPLEPLSPHSYLVCSSLASTKAGAAALELLNPTALFSNHSFFQPLFYSIYFNSTGLC